MGEAMVAAETVRRTAALLTAHGCGDGAGDRARWAPRIGHDMPLADYLDMLDEAARAAGEPLLGLRLSPRVGPDILGALGFLFLSAPDLGTALMMLARHVSAVQGATLSRLDLRDGRACFTYQVQQGSAAKRRQDAEFSLGIVLNLIRAYVGQDFCLSSLWLEHEPVAEVEDYIPHIGCRPRFGMPVNALLFPDEYLTRRSAPIDPRLFSVLEAQMRGQGDARGRRSTAQRVRDILFAAGEEGWTAESVARVLGMSLSTLHRRLSREGIAFRTLLAEVRRERAQAWLADEERPVGEIAHALGYAENACFTRAFRRWTGLSPRAYRRHHLIGA